MLSWDDFRFVKAIADSRSLAGAATSLGVNHSTVFRRLGQIERQLGSRLFERGRAGEHLVAGRRDDLRVDVRVRPAYDQPVRALLRDAYARPAAAADSGVFLVHLRFSDSIYFFFVSLIVTCSFA